MCILVFYQTSKQRGLLRVHNIRINLLGFQLAGFCGFVLVFLTEEREDWHVVDGFGFAGGFLPWALFKIFIFLFGIDFHPLRWLFVLWDFIIFRILAFLWFWLCFDWLEKILFVPLKFGVFLADFINVGFLGGL